MIVTCMGVSYTRSYMCSYMRSYTRNYTRRYKPRTVYCKVQLVQVVQSSARTR